ncbi:MULTISPECIES: ABC transporter ATP-binding protein [Romboutsia]|uniref:Fe(3+)-citrate import ATP-binding protein YfmF n=1 Tax=Romboutsia hominis TaxID=1507512 RepID=A0A2P2BP37_9FIRM|nr:MULTISPECIES: ABC transporter ATP-binding protein [Romboutsia]MCH1959235.1 ABC transporter ATP-binding protein [Romboutsia hominis]MCH1970134.1 ABC transporter ATP-binding protein [Romboutsia hominis]MDB8790187.1 ABC transporter ATP-binding protein [Romboutsia sp. 1001216sp1]MDB8792218.1 ABC transporter ATP-binding protein [Romboutsia sp. 1001216sp1]MDB8797185.1 ABC transporter ATP-binding protein [Romboutsia sp. 1001216sp1]
MNIKTEGVKLSIGNKNILKGIDINVENKEFVGIIGPNGSGKSTLLKCIYRNLKPSSGVIMLGDENLSTIPIKESAKKLAVLSQHNYYDFDFKVYDIVLMGRSPHKKIMERDSKEDFEIVDAALEKVGMTDFKERSFNTLSGGEQQRIILARALAQQTDCLVLDEPTNHLDIKHQLQLMSIVKGLNIEVIAAIHDLNIALMYCDKIYVLKDGEIIAYGTPSEVMTKELIKEVYEVDAIINKDENGKLVSISYNIYK